MHRFGYLFPFFLFFFFVSVDNVYAYLDPGSGSYIFQVILGVLLGALFLLKSYWKKIQSYIRNPFAGKPIRQAQGKQKNEKNQK